MQRRAVIATLPLFAVAGCGAILASPGVAPVVAAASNVATTAVNLWGIAKGMGNIVLTAALAVGEALDPELVPVVAGIKALIAAFDPLVTTAQTVAADAATLQAQANALQLLAAPHITVTANSTVAHT